MIKIERFVRLKKKEMGGKGLEGKQEDIRCASKIKCLRNIGLNLASSQMTSCREQYSTVQYSTVQYSTVQYSTAQYSTVQWSRVE